MAACDVERRRARRERPLRDVEGNVYFPPEAVNRRYLKDSTAHTTCAWKGVASYLRRRRRRADQRRRCVVLPRAQGLRR